ncbi:MAG: twin-arginine translocation signal domain-containing protein, partial [Candidatus Limnocylindrales bacterium]
MSGPEGPTTFGLPRVSRRDVLKGMAVVAGAAAVPTILAACSSTPTTAPG